jgi:hypothetical protein
MFIFDVTMLNNHDTRAQASNPSSGVMVANNPDAQPT